MGHNWINALQPMPKPAPEGSPADLRSALLARYRRALKADDFARAFSMVSAISMLDAGDYERLREVLDAWTPAPVGESPRLSELEARP